MREIKEQLLKQAEIENKSGLTNSKSVANLPAHQDEESMLGYLQGKKPEAKKDYQKKSLYNF